MLYQYYEEKFNTPNSFLLCIGGCALTIIIASSCEDKTSAQVHNPNEPITVTNFIRTQVASLRK